jgi:serine protease AprX
MPARARLVSRLRLSLLATPFVVAALTPASITVDAAPGASRKLAPVAQQRAARAAGQSTVIVRIADRKAARSAILAVGGTLGRSLPGISSQVATVPDAALAQLAENDAIERISIDGIAVGAMERTGATVGATQIREQLGLDGAGIGVAVIDSGIAYHDDLADAAGSQRVDRFVDFVAGGGTPYDDSGHGTHIAGIIAGNGHDSNGRRTGIAPAARLVVLKALDAAGHGRVSDVVAAIEYAVAHRHELNIRVINLSIATPVFESYETDPLTLAAKNAVEAGIVVVAAAGNNGVSPQGSTRYGGITAPGNAPWVLTVGGSSHMGTTIRDDDTVAKYSSRGPTAIDAAAKPDVLAPSVGIESLAVPGTALYQWGTPYLLPGTVASPELPYLSLSGTSMAAPVVAGSVALMLQVNPQLTPNEVKAVLQYTAEVNAYADPLTQGAGFLNTKGAVQLARYLAAPTTTSYPSTTGWSKRLIWGNYLVKGGRLTHQASAWSTAVVWGTGTLPSGAPVEWGIVCANWSCSNVSGPWRWTGSARNVVWGTLCGGGECSQPWSLTAVSGASDGETVVWGTTDNGETVVWGTIDDGETVVWGTADEGETVVWGTGDDGETVVWGTSCSSESCLPVIWRP